MPSEEQKGTKRSRGASSVKKKKVSASSAPAEDHRDRFGNLLSKSLDLLETGLELGVNLASRAGNVATDKMAEMTRKQAEAHAAPSGAPEAHETPPAQSPQSSEQEQGQKQVSVICNRLVLMQGSDARISFSIENESPTQPSKVLVNVGPVFTGQKSGFVIDGEGFTVAPATQEIAPMDFEKFVLSGTIPSDAIDDIYQGSLIVGGGDEYQIPVALVVGNVGQQ